MAAAVPWEEPILASINAPNTATNRYILDAWQQAEGGLSVEHANNPFNTTLDSANYPHVGNTSVPRYPSIGIGLQNTVRTLKEPAYSHLVKDLQIGASPQQFFQDLAASPWAGGHYEGNTLVQTLKAGGHPAVGGVAAPFSTSGGSDVGSGSDILPVTVDNPLSSVKGLIAFVTSWRFAEIVGGVLLLLVGLFLVGRALGVSVPVGTLASPAGSAADAAPGPISQQPRRAQKRAGFTLDADRKPARGSPGSAMLAEGDSLPY